MSNKNMGRSCVLSWSCLKVEPTALTTPIVSWNHAVYVLLWKLVSFFQQRCFLALLIVRGVKRVLIFIPKACHSYSNRINVDFALHFGPKLTHSASWQSAPFFVFSPSQKYHFISQVCAINLDSKSPFNTNRIWRQCPSVQSLTNLGSKRAGSRLTDS